MVPGADRTVEARDMQSRADQPTAQDGEVLPSEAGMSPAGKEMKTLIRSAQERLGLWAKERKAALAPKPPSLRDAIRRQADSRSGSGGGSSRASLQSTSSSRRGASDHGSGRGASGAAEHSAAGRIGVEPARAGLGVEAWDVLPHRQWESLRQEEANREKVYLRRSAGRQGASREDAPVYGRDPLQDREDASHAHSRDDGALVWRSGMSAPAVIQRRLSRRCRNTASIWSNRRARVKWTQ